MDRNLLIVRALWLEYLSIAWNVIEGGVAIGAGIVAGSIALVGFGLDSLIEVISAATLVWRLKKSGLASLEEESELEEQALRIIAITFFILAAYVGFESVKALWLKEAPKPSAVGIVITLLASMIMPSLAFAKRRVAELLNSQALKAEAMESFACGSLSVITLIGLVVNALWGWWWADPVAGLIIVVFLVKEGREAWEGECCRCMGPSG